jgi:sodium-dependent phosphate cotransporter
VHFLRSFWLTLSCSALFNLLHISVLRLEQMYPLTLGANIGTTVTAILAALVTEGPGPLQVALSHLFFNISGICIFYPIPFMRALPMNAARQLGKATRVWRGFPLLYIAVMFVLVPIVFLGISALFTEDTKGFTVLGSFITVIIGIGVFWTFYWFKFKGGSKKCADCMANREEKRIVMKELPDEMKYLRAKVAALIEHTGYSEEEEEGEKADEIDKDEEASDEVEIAA